VIYTVGAGDEPSSEGSGEGESADSGSSEGGSERQQIGQISDIVLTQDGQVDYVILGVGGFLGIGERNVAVNMDAIEFTPDPENEGEFLMMIPATQEDIENAPEFDSATLSPGGEGEGESGSGGGEEQSGSGDQQSDAEQAAQEAGQEAQEAGQAAEDAASSAGQEAQDAAQEAEQAAEDAAEQAGQAAEEAGNEAEEATSGN